MPRLPRLQYPGAIYHIVTRGEGRRKLFHDDGHYERFTRGLTEEVDRSGWIVIAYCWMPNHIHALIKTPQPNLCRGMQHWLSGYANWYAKRNCRTGHLFQGRYKAFPVEDEGYYWNLSRYIHLNPCKGSKPLVKRPEDEGTNRRRRRRMSPVTVDAILDATAKQYGTSADQYCVYRSYAGGRDVAAMLCRRWTTATLRELSGRFGLSHPDSASDLIKQGKLVAESNRGVARKVASIEKELGLNPETRA